MRRILVPAILLLASCSGDSTEPLTSTGDIALSVEVVPQEGTTCEYRLHADAEALNAVATWQSGTVAFQHAGGYNVTFDSDYWPSATIEPGEVMSGGWHGHGIEGASTGTWSADVEWTYQVEGDTRRSTVTFRCD